MKGNYASFSKISNSVRTDSRTRIPRLSLAAQPRRAQAQPSPRQPERWRRGHGQLGRRPGAEHRRLGQQHPRQRRRERDLRSGRDGRPRGRARQQLWVVDNQLYRNSGDGIQINAGGPGVTGTTHHIYVGRNTAYGNKQTGFWVKHATDVIFSQNVCHSHRLGNSSNGQCMGFQCTRPAMSGFCSTTSPTATTASPRNLTTTVSAQNRSSSGMSSTTFILQAVTTTRGMPGQARGSCWRAARTVA